MQIALIGANNRVGQAILKEALFRQHCVAVIDQNDSVNYSATVARLKRDPLQLTVEDLKPFQVVINAFYAPTDAQYLYQSTLTHLLEQLKQLTYSRLMIVGEAGSLYIDQARTMRLMDTALYPPAYRVHATHRVYALQLLQQNHHVNWTYLSPALYFNAGGPRTGQYQLAGEKLTYNPAGESTISYADYAVAMLDILFEPFTAQRHLSVVSA